MAAQCLTNSNSTNTEHKGIYSSDNENNEKPENKSTDTLGE